MDKLWKVSKLNLLISLFPLLYFLHDLEEIFTVEKFLTKHADIIPFTITTLQFTLAFLILWFLTFIGCYKAVKKQKFLGMAAHTFFSFLVPGIFLANGIGHFIQFIVFKSYVPGILTSILIIYPYSFFTLKYMLQHHILTTRKFLFFLFLGFILQGPFAFTALVVAKLLV